MRIEGNDQRLAAATAIQMQQTGVQQMLAQKTAQQQDGQKVGSENTVQSIAGDKVSIKIELPQKTIDTLQNMGNISDYLNSVATNLRQTNEGLAAANAVAEQMKASLDKIIKNYPPYSIDSKERIDQLMQYSSLRKQIMSLMTPPPPQPMYEKVKHLWEGLTSGIGGAIQTPSLPQGAPDSHVYAASKQLDSISSQIGLVQETMSNSVMRS
ncbi:MAG: hypothetical protein PHP95_13920 [Desulfuromonadaceae bacterium]|nr:hypothetical protein [Desulfuromonadaceae bacterium]MDD2849546.1 hypothetical protein [Desulfuromonadaceae bacterium]MDD4131972.1 hypothetical protein [Desulfuromonadaceae bacterium]